MAKATIRRSLADSEKGTGRTVGKRTSGAVFKLLAAVVLAVTPILAAGCAGQSAEPAEGRLPDGRLTASTLHSDGLNEDRSVYEWDNMTEVVDFYVTILERNRKGKDGLTFSELNSWYLFRDPQEKSPKLDIIIQEGTPDGPAPGKLGYGDTKANATIELRGNSAKLRNQKSYQIKLFDGTGLWRGQRTLNLNKHENDATRVRNKLSFDYFTMIPDFTSLRTQFVHLHVKDLTGDVPDADFVSYGLYTHIEQPNKRFLTAHGLDSAGNLYKANMFEFYRYPDQIELKSDPSYSKEAFETVLQIKGNDEHGQLIEMLEAVNNYDLNINDVVDTYFDRDNYLTWLAVNLLTGNHDTDAQNFFLYNPLNSPKFYFLPWDYDAAWGQEKRNNEEYPGFIAKWQLGISNYWGSVLHSRFFKDPANIEALSAKIEELSAIIRPEQTERFLAAYKPIVEAFIHSEPDINGYPVRLERFGLEYASLSAEPELNKKIYYETLENPMPVYLDDPWETNGKMQFAWSRSYDLQGDDLTYTVRISRDPAFESVYLERANLKETSVDIDRNELAEGRNYWGVVITDAKGNTQIAFDRILGDEAVYNGVREFYVD